MTGSRTNYLHRDELSKREIEVLKLSAEGFTTKEIAKKLFLEEQTVKFHRTHIFQKLEVTNIIQAIVIGIKNGLINCPCDKNREHEVTIDGHRYERSE